MQDVSYHDPADPARVLSVQGDYWSQSRRPLTSLVFAGPLLAIYEAGLIWLGPHAMRNGAEAWLRQMLDFLGFNAYFLLPALTVSILLAWHHVLRQPWQVSRRVLYGMAMECASLAPALWLFWKLLCRFLLQPVVPYLVNAAAPAAIANTPGFLGMIVCYLGAGIYEELLFRLILLNLGVGLLAWLRAGPKASVIGGIVLTSLLFSAAHYIGAGGDKFSWLTFLFRFLAGVFFAVLFRYRGFGIAAGTHALYDVLAGLSKLAGG